MKVLADPSSRKLIGAQIVGGEEVTGRINWLGAVIVKGVTADEFQVGFENAYCPPVSMVKDVVNEGSRRPSHQTWKMSPMSRVHVPS